MGKHKKAPDRKTPDKSGATPVFESEDYMLILLAIITAIGIVLRIYHLDFNSIWLDEAATYYHSTSIASIFDYTNSVDYFNPPAFFLFEFVAIYFTGASEWGLRIFPALFGILTIPTAYIMGKEFKNMYTGIITASVFAFSPFLIYYSQEARPFSMLLLLCTLAMYIYLKALKSNDRLHWIYFGLTSAAIFCTHFYGVVFLAPLVIFAAIKYRSDITGLLMGIGVAVFTTLPLSILTVSLYLQRTAAGAPTYGLQGVNVITGTFSQMLGFAGGYSEMIFLVLFAAGIIWLVFREMEEAYLLLFLTTIPLIVGVVMSFYIPILPRYMIFLIIPVALGISALHQPISNLASHGTKKLAVAILLIVAVGLLGVTFYGEYYNTYSKEDWRGMAQDISIDAVPGDVIVPLPSYIDMPFRFYYNASEHGITILKVMNLTELEKTASTSHSTYYILTYDILAVEGGLDMMQWVRGDNPMYSKYGNLIVVKR